jgi:hypothetical protein
MMRKMDVGSINGYMTIILILSVFLLVMSIVLLYLLGSEKRRTVYESDGLFRKTGVERSTEELPRRMNKTENNTESLQPVISAEEQNEEKMPMFYELQSIVFIHTDTIIE